MTQNCSPSTHARNPQVIFAEFQDFLDEVGVLPGELYSCSDFNCPSRAAGHAIMQLESVIDLVRHVTESTKKHDVILDRVITNSHNLVIACTNVYNMVFLDHFMVT